MENGSLSARQKKAGEAEEFAELVGRIRDWIRREGPKSENAEQLMLKLEKRLEGRISKFVLDYLKTPNHVFFPDAVIEIVYDLRDAVFDLSHRHAEFEKSSKGFNVCFARCASNAMRTIRRENGLVGRKQGMGKDAKSFDEPLPGKGEGKSVTLGEATSDPTLRTLDQIYDDFSLSITDGKLLEAIGALSREHQEVMRLFYHGLRFVDMEEPLGISAKTASKRFREAARLVREQLEG